MNFDKYGRVYVSDATGYNYGLELTLERFLSQGWYIWRRLLFSKASSGVLTTY